MSARTGMAGCIGLLTSWVAGWSCTPSTTPSEGTREAHAPLAQSAPSSPVPEPAPVPETEPESAPEPPPPLAPVPTITTDVDPAILYWSHGTDELAFLELELRLGDGPEAERLRELGRTHQGRGKGLRSIGRDDRLRRGDRWRVFDAENSGFRGKIREFWPDLYDEQTLALRVALGPGPEGLAVRASDWTQPVPKARWGPFIEAEDPRRAQIVEVLQRSLDTFTEPDVAKLLRDHEWSANDLSAIEGNFCGGTYLVRIDVRPSIMGVVLVGMDGRVTPIIPVEVMDTASGHMLDIVIDLDGDGYEEAVIHRAERLGSYANLLYWRDGQPTLEPLVVEEVTDP